MINKQQATKRQGTLKAKPAKVQSPQHQHPHDITILGVDEQVDDEVQGTTSKPAISASPQPTNSQPAARRDMGTQRGKQKASSYTQGIDFTAVGVSKKGGKFLLVGKDEKYVVLSVRNLQRDPSAELERLEALDVHLLVPQARTAFLQRAQEAARMQPTFQVATQIGWFDDVFVLPDRIYPPQPPIKGMPPGWSRVLVHLDAKDEDIHSRFHCSGSPSQSREIFRLCRGNSRLIFAAALSFVGPCCKPFGLRAPGVQAVGKDGSGKTVFGIIAGATYGGVAHSTLGFGSAWNGTPNGLEEYGPAHNDTLMVLDETSLLPNDQNGRPLAFGEALMRLMQGQGKKRHRQSVDRWSVPFISSSNSSVYALLDPQRKKSYGAYTDRLIDIPTPKRSPSHFEVLYGFKDAATFGKHLFDLATENFGYPIRVFLDRLTAELARDRAGLVAVVAGNVAKYEAAASGIASPRRDVLRVRGYFATVYAAGCLAIRYHILPFTEDDLLAAILSCHRDHVAFVDNEVAGGPSWINEAAGAQSINPAPVALGTVASPDRSPLARLKRYLDANIPHGLIDLRDPATALPQDHDHDNAPGYIGIHDKKIELWFSNRRFEKIAGGKRDGQVLKQLLAGRRVVMVWGRGHGKVGPTVKRRIANLGLQWVVAIRPSQAMLVALRGRKRQGPRFDGLRRLGAVPGKPKTVGPANCRGRREDHALKE